MKYCMLVFAVLVSLMGLNSAQAARHGMYPMNAQNVIPSLKSKGVTHFNYYGGPIIAHVKVYSVFWGSNVDKSTQEQIGPFYSAILNSNYVDWLKEYDTNLQGINAHAGTNQSIGRGTYQGEITIQPKNTSTQIDDSDIAAELEYQVSIHVLPMPDENTLFMTYFPDGMTITAFKTTACQDFCGYHSNWNSKTAGNIFYGVFPSLSGACAFGCGTEDQEFDNLTSISSHELTESITDPNPTPGTQPAYPQAWNTATGDEVGDVCVGTAIVLKAKDRSYVLQGEFDNLAGSCNQGTYQTQ